MSVKNLNSMLFLRAFTILETFDYVFAKEQTISALEIFSFLDKNINNNYLLIHVTMSE